MICKEPCEEAPEQGDALDNDYFAAEPFHAVPVEEGEDVGDWSDIYASKDKLIGGT